MALKLFTINSNVNCYNPHPYYYTIKSNVIILSPASSSLINLFLYDCPNLGYERTLGIAFAEVRFNRPDAFPVIGRTV